MLRCHRPSRCPRRAALSPCFALWPVARAARSSRPGRSPWRDDRVRWWACRDTRMVRGRTARARPHGGFLFQALQAIHVSANRTWRGEPHIALVAPLCNVLQCAAQMAQAIRLADQIGMQGDAHYQRLLAGLFEHLVDVVDDELGKVLAVHLARHDHRDVVDFLRVWNRPQGLAVAGLHARRLVIVAPVQGVAITAFEQQIRRGEALRNPWRQPAGRRLAAVHLHSAAAVLQQRPFGGFVERALLMGIAVTVADQFVAARDEGCDQFGAVIIERRVGQHADRQAETVEQLQAAPGTDTVAVFAPCVVEHVRLRAHRTQARAQPLAKGEMLDVEAEIDGQPGTMGPAVMWAPYDRAVTEAAMNGQGVERSPMDRRCCVLRLAGHLFSLSAGCWVQWKY